LLFLKIILIMLDASMLITHGEARRIVDLVDRIEVDILQRGLTDGDRYLRTAETAKMLGVDSSLANQALQVLVKRQRLLRRPRVGTVIRGSGVSQMTSTIERVNLLSGNRKHTVDIMVDSGELLGLQGELPGARIQFSVVPPADEANYLEATVAEALRSRGNEVFVLHHSSIGMQRVISASGLPAVVQGGVYPSITNLPSLNSDHYSAAKLATEYALSRGHRRLVIVARQDQFPRADVVFNTIFRTASACGLPVEAIDLRFTPNDAGLGATLAAEVLDAEPQAPGILVFSRLVADAVSDTITARGLRVGQDVMLATLDYPILPNNRPNYPYLERLVSSEEAGALLGRMLKQALQSGTAGMADQIMPVRLRMPDEGSGAECAITSQ
jgi:DNA-binding LacI/PurR family transcriptional regulator/DNA-binding transcriptional regulator YhcF (GntR family)